MSFEPPAGILDIGNATLRVGKLEVAETSGLNQGLQNIIKNDLLITENTEYTTNQKWGLKLPTTWVGEFEVKGHSGKYIDFNFYNENSASNAQGYNLTFKDTTMTLRYDGGNPLGGGAATIPTIVGAFRKVNIFFERGVISVSIDGTRYIYHKESDGFNQGLGVASRVVSTTGSAFVNLFIEQNAADSAFKNLRIVNGRFISDETSNIAFIGGNLGVGVNSPQETLDIRGNMHFNRVSNVSSVSVDSNVVTEYTGPHDRPLRKYPEVALTADDNSSTSGYVASTSTSPLVNIGEPYRAFDGDNTAVYHTNYPTVTYNSDGTYGANSGASKITDVNNVNHDGEWLKIQLPKAIKVEYMKFQARVSYQNRFPNKLSILGSNDNSNWYLLLRDDNVPLLPANPAFHTIQINATTKYKYYVLVLRELSHSAAPSTTGQVAGWELYGYEEGSGSLDTTLKTVYNVPATTGTQLEVYYDAKDLADGAVTSVEDLSPNSNGGLPSDSPQISNGAFVFDGVNDYIYNSQSGFTDGKTYTASAWIKKTANINGCVFQFGNGSSGNSIGIFYYGGTLDYIRAYVFGYAVANSKSSNIPLNEWIHVTGVYSDKTATLYINGIEVATGTGSTGITIPSTPYLTIGAQTDNTNTPYTGTYFTGSIANFRLYSKVLNADQVKELYDYQKDYFLGSKSQVTLYKGHLGVGVTEPSGQLELAGDERLQQYPPGPLSNYETLIPGHGVFCAYDSSTVYSTAGWKAFAPFDNSVLYWAAGSGIYSTTSGAAGGVYNSAHASAKRLSPTTEFGEYLILELPYKIVLSKVYISARNSHSFKAPSNFTIYGSNNNSDWSTLLTVTGATPSQTGGNYYPGGSDSGTSTSIGDMTPYKYLAIVVSKAAGGSDIGDGTSSPGTIDAMMIANISYFGTPGPTTLDKGSLTLGRSLDVPRVSRYDVDTETPRPEKLLVDFDTNIPPFNNQFIEDKSGRGKDGIPYGNATHSTADKAFVFDGSGDYIKATGIGNASGVWEHSVSLWFKLENIAQAQALWYIDGDSAGTAYNTPHVVVGTDGRIRFDMWNSAVYSPDDTIAGGTWYHVVTSLSATNNTKSIYINGTLVATHTTSDTHVVDANASVWIGAYGDASSPMTGKISNFKVYDTVLEPSEVKKLYNLGRTGRSMILADTSLQIGAGLHDSIAPTGGPRATLDVHGSILASSTIHGMSGNFHKMLGYARGGGQADHHRADNCLVAMGGMTVAGSGNINIGFLIRKSSAWMPYFMEVRHTGINSNSGSLFARNYNVFGGINGTSETSTGDNDGVVMSVGARGNDTVLLNVEINREGRSYGACTVRLVYYYGIKGREY